jgi:hypothetical protein
MIAQTNLDSMYFSGKGLSKFATIVYTINDLAKNSALAQTGLANLKTAFATFINNKQTYPLVYESTSEPKTSIHLTDNCSCLERGRFHRFICDWRLWSRFWQHLLQYVLGSMSNLHLDSI